MVDVVIGFDICGRQAAICRWLPTIRLESYQSSSATYYTFRVLGLVSREAKECSRCQEGGNDKEKWYPRKALRRYMQKQLSHY